MGTRPNPPSPRSFPSITALKGALARSKFMTAMTAYLHHKGHEQASDLTKARYKAGIIYGLSILATAPSEIGSIMGIVLLADIRGEAYVAMLNGDEGRETEKNSIVDIPSPNLLYSTHQEALHFHIHNTSSRMVMQDTLLADQYLLEKDSIVQNPGGSVHSNLFVWGTDATSFDPRRFLKPTATGEKQEGPRQHPGAFRSFGGGVSLCPGISRQRRSVLRRRCL
ncbi:MAG: hypothetical protein Q9181_005251 [Wetmoreana brouardii]